MNGVKLLPTRMKKMLLILTGTILEATEKHLKLLLPARPPLNP